MRKILIVDIYDLGIKSYKEFFIPKKYKNWEIIWNLREALLVLASGDISKVALPKEKLPGYDFEKHISSMVSFGTLSTSINIEYYGAEAEIST